MAAVVTAAACDVDLSLSVCRDPTLNLPARFIGRRRPPSGIGMLFPGLDLHSPGTAARATNISCHSSKRLSGRQRTNVFTLGEGLLEIPRFQPGRHWLSGTVLAGFAADGRALEGSMRRALADVPGNGPILARASLAARRLVDERLGGQFWAAPPASGLLADSGGGLTVVVACAFDDAASRRMLADAVAGAAASRTLLVVPENARLSGTLADALGAGCRVAHAPLDPWPILAVAGDCHVAGGDCDCCGQFGALALLAGPRVHCRRPAWFSDAGVPADRDAFAAAALIAGATYADPFTGQACEVERALDLAAEWRRLCDANRRVAVCVGMQFWKRRRIAQFLHDGTRPPVFRRTAAKAIEAARKAGGGVAVWASRMPPGMEAAATAAKVGLARVEDGFLRSVGLGSDFMPPCSIVLDESGLYYDPAQPSDLESLLATVTFTPALLARARALVERVVRVGLTKYNTGAAGLPPLPGDGRRIVLVVGQVADDLSVRLGGGAARDNAGLLRRVRAASPDAFILYRPHPDVDAGHRPGAVPDAEALRDADALARGIPMGALIGAVDELHTISSLAGFEALLRGRRVVVWGRPFYAGWGLTRDMVAIARRTRRLRLDELAAATLLLYPRYLDPVTGMPCPAEVLLDRLADRDLWRPGLLVRLRRIQGRAANGWNRALSGTRVGPL